jgi:pyrimidine operon attenuation protein/uracil phosphoribosyltransferase
VKEIIDATKMQRMLLRLTHEIAEKNNTFDDMVLVGIKTRGLFLAKRLEQLLVELYEVHVPVEALDIGNYRDDGAKTKGSSGIVRNLAGATVVLVDDVLYTGRTVRAALDALVDHGRPSRIELLTLIDRGHREYPIRPDFVGKNIPSAKDETVVVNMTEIDAADCVTICTMTKDKR